MIHGAPIHIVADGPDPHASDTHGIYDLEGRLGTFRTMLRKGADGPSKDIAYLQPDDETSRTFDTKNLRQKVNASSQYSRIVALPNLTNRPSSEALTALAQQLRQMRRTDTWSDIPAEYTYFGQLLAHDLAHTEPGTFEVDHGDLGPVSVPTQSTHKLDFETLFGAGPLACPCSDQHLCKGGLSLGKATDGRFLDLPRDDKGQAQIPDPRNDHNLVLAQLVVAITRFHHLVGDLCQPTSKAEWKNITIRHLQSIALQDFAPRFVHPDIIEDVHKHGRSSVSPSGPTDFRVPAEFAMAIFRFGHSLVRPAYTVRHNLVNEPLIEMFDHTGGGTKIGKENPNLDRDWTINWAKFRNPPQNTQQKARRLDVELTGPLNQLPDHVIDPDTLTSGLGSNDLTQLSLVRGRAAELPSGQVLAETMMKHQLQTYGSETPPASLAIIPLDETQIEATENTALRQFLTETNHGRAIAKSTPLWFYTLREAEIYRQAGDSWLGPLAGRVVYETLHAAVSSAPNSIIENDRQITFQRHEKIKGAEKHRFTLQDLLDLVTSKQPEEYS